MYWMGGNDLATKDRWAWASNGYRIYPYANWKAETDEGGRCIGLDAFTFEWINSPCDTMSEYFCEKSE
jgi:hypothetical protein